MAVACNNWLAKGGRRPRREPRPSLPQGGAPSPPGRSAASPDANCGVVLAAPCSALSAAHHVTNRAELMFCLEPMPIEPALLPFDLHVLAIGTGSAKRTNADGSQPIFFRFRGPEPEE
ncbi:hypothetical protein EJB05_16999, partial [Eragrostis curvula]